MESLMKKLILVLAVLLIGFAAAAGKLPSWPLEPAFLQSSGFASKVNSASKVSILQLKCIPALHEKANLHEKWRVVSVY